MPDGSRLRRAFDDDGLLKNRFGADRTISTGTALQTAHRAAAKGDLPVPVPADPDKGLRRSVVQ